jgi:ferredoxin
VRIPAHECINCHKKLDGVTGLNGADAPNEHSITLCIYCGAVMKLCPNGTVRAFTETERDALFADKDTMQIIVTTLREIVRMNMLRAARN